MKNIICWTISFLFFIQGCIIPKPTNDSKDYPKALQAAYEIAHKTDNIRSFLVSKADTLIAEQYFDQYGRDSLDHVRSVTKSVMAILIGIAIDKGIIVDVNDSIGKYLGEKANGKSQITIKHLLTMTSGISWNEGGNAEGYGAWAGSPNELQYVLDKPMAVTPGTVWNYNSGSIHILSAILTDASGMSTLQFANKYLFKPLGIKNIRWEKQSDGYYNGAAGLELKPRDMIWFGQLIANEGLVNGQRIISEKFLLEATSHQQPIDMKLDEGAGYGYCWYVSEEDDFRVFAALGYAGQVIAICPELNAVIAITNYWRVNGKKSVKQDRQSVNVIMVKAIEGMLENKKD